MDYQPERIVSGGQTGADREGLDWAIARGIPHGGFCPKGRLAEDGVIPPQYRLIQTTSADYRERTEINVKTGDATLVFVGAKIGRGSRLTAQLCDAHHKPHLVVDPTTSVATVSDFLNQHRPRVLNIAGSRASSDPQIYARVQRVLDAVLGQPNTRKVA